MLTLHTKLAGATRIDARLILPYDARVKCRLRALLSDGETVAVYTPRGSVLRDGDLLSGDDGRIVQVVAEDEAVLTVRCADPLDLLRCAFHLGNRHCQVQLGAGWLRLRDDPVLREMLRGLGAEVSAGMAPFEPEAGAYGGGHHHHDHLLAPVPLRQKIHRPGEPA